MARWIPAVVIGTVIFALSSIPGAAINSISKGQELYNVNAHFFLYMALYIALYYATNGHRVSFLLLLSYALTDEIHQTLVPGRDFQAFDIIVDALGGLISAGAIWKFNPKALKIPRN